MIWLGPPIELNKITLLTHVDRLLEDLSGMHRIANTPAVHKEQPWTFLCPMIMNCGDGETVCFEECSNGRNFTCRDTEFWCSDCFVMAK